MSKLTLHPEVIAEELRRNPKLSKAAADAAAQATQRSVCLSYLDGGYFRITWAVNNPGSYDWVGLYASDGDDDNSGYITWQYVTNGSPYDTSAIVRPGYQARYLVWDSGGQKYKSVARTAGFPNDPVTSVSTAYPRKPNQDEWEVIKAYFPNLIREDTWLTGPANKVYNCIAWSLGFDDRWIPPDSPLSAFIAQYQSYGCQHIGRLNPKASIDGWGTSVEVCTHGSKIYTGVSVGKSGLWESKLGDGWRLTHNREGLKGEVYGEILESFLESVNIPAMPRISMANLPLWSEEDEQKLRNAIALVSEYQKNAFESAFSAWEASWSTGDLYYSSDTKDRAEGEEFEALKAMGAEIIPLVVEKLRDPSKFMALVLYESLQKNYDLIITYTDEDDIRTLLEGEQMRAQRTIRLWLDGLY